MPQPRFEFAVAADMDTDAGSWLTAVRSYEAAGYDAVVVSDHVAQRLAPTVALGAAASVTSRLRLGTAVLNADLRNPALVAAELSTLDELCDGRLIAGLGAGWYARDYALAGVALRAGRRRFDALRETVKVVRDVLGERAAAADRTPARLMLGGARSAVLAFAAAEADIVSVVPPLGPDGPAGHEAMAPDRLDAAIDPLRAMCAQRPVPPSLGTIIWHCYVTGRPGPLVDGLARALRCAPELVPHLSGVLVGTPAQVADELLHRRHRWGLSFVTVPASAAPAFAPVLAELRQRDDRDGSGGPAEGNDATCEHC